MKIFKNDWADFLDAELQKPYYQELRRFLISEYRSRKIYPDKIVIARKFFARMWGIAGENFQE